MKKKKIMQLIRTEVTVAQEDGSTDKVIEKLQKKVRSTNKLEDCLMMYLAVNKMADLIENPVFGYLKDLNMDKYYANASVIDFHRILQFNYHWDTDDYRKFLRYLVEELRNRGYEQVYISNQDGYQLFFVDVDVFLEYAELPESLEIVKSHHYKKNDYLKQLDKVYKEYKNRTLDIYEMSADEIDILLTIKRGSEDYLNDSDSNKYLAMYEMLDKKGLLDIIDVSKIDEINKNDFVSFIQGFSYSLTEEGSLQKLFEKAEECIAV